MNELKKIDIQRAAEALSEYWTPQELALVNDHALRVGKIKGDSHTHRHLEGDEAFIVLKGEIFIQIDGEELCLKEGQLFVVPRGTTHRPYAPSEALILMFEPSDLSFSLSEEIMEK